MATVQQYAVELTADGTKFKGEFGSLNKIITNFTTTVINAFKGVDAQLTKLASSVDKAFESIIEAEKSGAKEQIKVIRGAAEEKIKVEQATGKRRRKIAEDGVKEIEQVVKQSEEKIKQVVKQASKGFAFRFPIDEAQKNLTDLATMVRDFRTNDLAFNRRFQDASKQIREAAVKNDIDAAQKGFAQIESALRVANARQVSENSKALAAKKIDAETYNKQRLALEQQLAVHLERTAQTQSQSIRQIEAKQAQERLKSAQANTKLITQAEIQAQKEREKLAKQADAQLKAQMKSMGKGFGFRVPIDGVRKDLDDLSSLIRDFRTNDNSFNRKFEDSKRKIREAGARGELSEVRKGFDQIARSVHEANARRLADLKQAEQAGLVTVQQAHAKRLRMEQELSQQLARTTQTRDAELSRVQAQGPQRRVGQIQGGQIFANIGAEAARAQLGAMAGPLGNITGMLGKIHPVALAATAGLGLLAAGFSKASAAGAELEQGTAKIQSVLSGNQAAGLAKEIGNLRQEAASTGIPVRELQDGLYNVIGAVPALANNLGAATAITEKAAKTALGMGASTDSVAMAMTGMGNAAGLSLENLGNQNLLMNVLAKTMKDGVIPSGEALAGAIGKAAPTIAALSANGQTAVKSIGAMTAALTGAGISVDESQTKIKALGNELLDTEKRAQLLAKGVKGIDEATGKVTSYKDLFTSIAAGGADLVNVFSSTESKDAIRIFTANGGKAIADLLDGFENAEGTADAMFNAMANTAEQTGKRMDASINEFWLTVNDSIGASGITADLQSFAADAIGSLTEFLKPASQLFDETIAKANELNQLQSTSADIASQIGEALSSTEGISAGGAEVIFSQISSQMENIAEQSPIAAQEIQKMMDGVKTGSIDTATAMGAIKKEMEDISTLAEGNKMNAAMEASKHSIEAVNEVLDEATGWWDDIAEGIETALNVLFPFTNLISGMASMFGFDIGESMQADTFKDMASDLEGAKTRLAELKAEAQGLKADPQAFAEKMKEVIEAQKEVNKLAGDSDKIQKGLNDAVKQQLDIQLQLLGGNAEQIDKLGLAAQIASQFPDALAESAGFQEQINKLVDEELAGAAQRAKDKETELQTNAKIEQIKAGLISQDIEEVRLASDKLILLDSQANAGNKIVEDLIKQSGLQGEIAGAKKTHLLMELEIFQEYEKQGIALTKENQLRYDGLKLQLQKIEQMEFENQLLEIQNAKLVEQADLEENINQRLDMMKETLGVEQLTNAERISGLKTILAQNEAKIKQLEIEKQQAGLSKDRQVQLEKELNVMKARAGETKGQLDKAQTTQTARQLLGTKDPVLVQREKKAQEERIKEQEKLAKEQADAQKKLDSEIEKERKEAEKEKQDALKRELDIEMAGRKARLEKELKAMDDRVKAEEDRISREKALANELQAIQKKFSEGTAKIIEDAASHIENIRQEISPSANATGIQKVMQSAFDAVTKVEAQAKAELTEEQKKLAQIDKELRLEQKKRADTEATQRQFIAQSTKYITTLNDQLSSKKAPGASPELVSMGKGLDTRNIPETIKFMEKLLAEQAAFPAAFKGTFEQLADPIKGITEIGRTGQLVVLQKSFTDANDAVLKLEKDYADLQTKINEAKPKIDEQRQDISGIKILEGQVLLMQELLKVSEDTEEGLRNAFDEKSLKDFRDETGKATAELQEIVKVFTNQNVDASNFGPKIIQDIEAQIKDAKEAFKKGSLDPFFKVSESEQKALDNAQAVLAVLKKQFGVVEEIAKLNPDDDKYISELFRAEEALGRIEGTLSEIDSQNKELVQSTLKIGDAITMDELALEQSLFYKEGLLGGANKEQAAKLKEEIEELKQALAGIGKVKLFEETEQAVKNTNIALEDTLKANEKTFELSDKDAQASQNKLDSDKEALDVAFDALNKRRTALQGQVGLEGELKKVKDEMYQIELKQTANKEAQEKLDEEARQKAKEKIKSAIEGSSFDKFATEDTAAFVENFKQGIEDIKTAAKEGGKEGKAAATAAVMGMVQGFANVTEGLIVQGKAISDMFQSGDAGGATQAAGDLTTQIGKALLGAKNPNIQIAGAVILGIGLLTTAVGRIISAIKGKEQSALDVAKARGEAEQRSRDAMERQLEAMELMVKLGDRQLDQAEEQARYRQQEHDRLVASSQLARQMSQATDDQLLAGKANAENKKAETEALIAQLEASKELSQDAKKRALEEAGFDFGRFASQDEIDEALESLQTRLQIIDNTLSAADYELEFRAGNLEGVTKQLDEYFAKRDFIVNLALEAGGAEDFTEALLTQMESVTQATNAAEGALASIGQTVDFTGMSVTEIQDAILALDFAQISPEIQEMLNGVLEAARVMEDISRKALQDERDLLDLRTEAFIIDDTQARAEKIDSLATELAFLTSIHAEEEDRLAIIKQIHDLQLEGFADQQNLIKLREEAGVISEQDAQAQMLASLEDELRHMILINASEEEQLRIQIEINNLKKEGNKEDEKELENLSKVIRARQEFVKTQRAQNNGAPMNNQQKQELEQHNQAIASQLRANGASEDEIASVIADLPAFSKGGKVKETGMGLLTEDEIVLTEQQQKAIHDQVTMLASLLSNPIADGTDNLSRTIAQTILQREVNNYIINQTIDLSGLSINLNLSTGSPQAVAKEVQKVIPSVIHDIVNRGLQENKIDIRQGNSV